MPIDSIDLFSPIDSPLQEEMVSATLTSSYWQQIWHRFKKSRLGLSGLIFLALLISFAILGPFLSGYTYDEIHLTLKNQSPSKAFWFGSDDLGRDIFTRVWYGARISLFIGMIAALLDCLVGILWGGIAGLAGGRIDEILMRIADILYSLPYLLIVVILLMIVGPGFLSLILAMTLLGWITMARIVRGQILLLREMDYVLAARALGASFGRILFKHLLPNALSSILVTLTLTIPSAIFTEAFLSFLGLGIQAPISSWGTMAHEGLAALPYYPWRLFFPAFFISLTLLSFYLLGEGLRETFLQTEQRKQM